MNVGAQHEYQQSRAQVHDSSQFAQNRQLFSVTTVCSMSNYTMQSFCLKREWRSLMQPTSQSLPVLLSCSATASQLDFFEIDIICLGFLDC